MGCCVSTKKEAEAEASSISNKDRLVNAGSEEASKLKGFNHESRAPPPSAEEETVKEVLSETPKPKPIPKPETNFTSHFKQEQTEEEVKNAQKAEVFVKIQESLHYENNMEKKQQLNSNEEIMSEESEICSLSMSESVSTLTNITDKRDYEDEQEVKHQRVSRSPAKLQPRNGVKNRVVNQSPTRRTDQSPGRRINSGSIRFAQSSREESAQRRGLTSNRGRRDPGESSGRRSRSPATTRSSAAMGRSPSARRANRSPGRVKTDPIESSNGSINNSRRVDGRNTEGKWPSNNNNNNSSSINNDCSTSESLENPLVSLECFIFL
ncbi:serine/arginine repetitive matrix protein 1-like [Melia azedarach]|uniref:Serine/arginine repetitive matrix protein 1-like n=1 Tax=Melia azedarach TaxID=155640 RepID=A0ACC1WWN7_MELAZ|nr:serine/arginine repetitive matrix protein 1-like [Melia azedarach]